MFTGWTLYISLSNSSLLPTYGFVGLDNYASLWANRRWNIAYTNLFFFSGFYIVGSMAVGLLLAILIDQRVRGEAAWRTIFLYPLAVSFIVTGTVWSWLYNPVDGIQALVRGFGWTSFSFALASDRHYAIYAVIITGVWQSSGFAMALFWLVCARWIGLVKAAQIDGASTFRIYRKVLRQRLRRFWRSPSSRSSSPSRPSTRGGSHENGPGIHHVPAIYVYDLMFQRGQIGGAAAVMMLAALAVAGALFVLGGLASAQGSRPARHGPIIDHRAATVAARRHSSPAS